MRAATRLATAAVLMLAASFAGQSLAVRGDRHPAAVRHGVGLGVQHASPEVR